MSMTKKRMTGKKMISNRGVTPDVEEASRMTTPATHHVKSLSHPKDAHASPPGQEHFSGGRGAPHCVTEKAGHLYEHREGFTSNMGNVAPPYDCACEEINDMEPGSLGHG